MQVECLTVNFCNLNLFIDIPCNGTKLVNNKRQSLNYLLASTFQVFDGNCSLSEIGIVFV